MGEEDEGRRKGAHGRSGVLQPTTLKLTSLLHTARGCRQRMDEREKEQYNKEKKKGDIFK